MRHIGICLIVLLAVPLAAAPVVPDAAESPYPLMSLGIPDQTINGWYERGNPEQEARELEGYLQTLIWGPGGEAEARAQGRKIEVELVAGQVIMRETPENIERIRKEVDPSLQTVLRRMELQERPAAGQVADGTFAAAPGALPGVRVVGPDAAQAQPGVAAASVARLGSVASFTLKIDDDRTWRTLRVTLLDIFFDGDVNRLTAVLKVETPDIEDEVEIAARRSTNFEGYRIRIVDATETPEPQAEIEVSLLAATSR